MNDPTTATATPSPPPSSSSLSILQQLFHSRSPLVTWVMLVGGVLFVFTGTWISWNQWRLGLYRSETSSILIHNRTSHNGSFPTTTAQSYSSTLTASPAVATLKTERPTPNPATWVTKTPIAIKPVSTSINNKISSCFISCGGRDGLGHQMEAKLSCLATAMALNMTYVHQPFKRIQHLNGVVDISQLEHLLGMSDFIQLLQQSNKNFKLQYAVGTLYNSTVHEIVQRQPLPRIGLCKHNSWFHTYLDEKDLYHQKKKKHTKQICTIHKVKGNNNDGKKLPVYGADNCWDFLYCHNKLVPTKFWDTVLPALRTIFITNYQQQQSEEASTQLDLPSSTASSSSTPTSNELESIIRVVVHVRLGDANKRKTTGSWAKKILDQLALQQMSLSEETIVADETTATAATITDDDDNTSQAQSPNTLSKSTKIRITIHSDGTEEEVRAYLKLPSSPTTTAMTKHTSTTGILNNLTTIKGSDYPNKVTIQQALYEMISSNILIASQSSLSRIAGFYNTNHGIIIHPPEKERNAIIEFPKWYMLRLQTENEQVSEMDTATLQVCNKRGGLYGICKQWGNVTTQFWNRLLLSI